MMMMMMIMLEFYSYLLSFLTVYVINISGVCFVYFNGL